MKRPVFVWIQPAAFALAVLAAGCARAPVKGGDSEIEVASAGSPDASTGATAEEQPLDAGVADEVRADPNCPDSAPRIDSRCARENQVCAYGERPECGTVFGCYRSKWVQVSAAPCRDADRGRCPSRPGPPPAEDAQRAGGLVCIYPDARSCSYQYPPAEVQCSGVEREEPITIPTPTWTCAPARVDPCQFARQGESCSAEGLACGPRCCSDDLECERGKWVLRMYPCPP